MHTCQKQANLEAGSFREETKEVEEDHREVQEI